MKQLAHAFNKAFREKQETQTQQPPTREQLFMNFRKRYPNASAEDIENFVLEQANQ